MASSFDQRYFELTNQDPYIQSVARPGQTIVKKMPYNYGVTVGSAAVPLTLAAGAQQATLITRSDSDFALTSLAGCVLMTANADMKFNRNLTVQIQDTSTGKTFFSAPTVMALVFGGGGFPLVLPAPRVIRPNTGLLFTVQNRDTGQDYVEMFITLGGTLIFYAES